LLVRKAVRLDDALIATWRWVMFVNIPVGIVLAAVVAGCLRPQHTDDARAKLDVLGASTVTLALASFLYAISQSVHAGWTSSTVLSALATALIMFVAFIAAERRSAQPLINFEIFRLRNVTIGMAMVLSLGAVLTVSMFFLSQALQRIDGRSPLDTGLALLPMASALAIASIASRYLRDAGFEKLPFIGSLVSAAGLIWLNWLPAHPLQACDFLLPTLLVGAGNGLVMMSATQAVLAGVPRKDSGLAAGLQNTARQLGGAVGIAVLGAVAHSVMAAQLATGQLPQAAELAGYRFAFLIAGIVSVVSAVASLMLKQAPASKD
jgi:MFS family permease